MGGGGGGQAVLLFSHHHSGLNSLLVQPYIATYTSGQP